MEGILVIIAFAVIALVSAAAKSKARGNANRNADGQGQPPPQRSVPLSDIQRAFMMTQENAPPPQPPQTAPRPVYTPPQAAYTPMQTRTAAPMQSRMSAPMESRMSAPLESRMSAPMEARTSAAVPSHPMFGQQTAAQPDAFAARQQAFARTASPNTLPQDFYSGSMGMPSREGIRDTEGDETPLVTVRNAAIESVADLDLETLSDLGAPVRSVRIAPAEKPRKGLPVKLFDSKNEYVKAIIYSEVLARRTRGRHRA